MTIERLLFDSQGQIGRKQFWFAHLLLFPLEIGAAFLFRVHDNFLCQMDPAQTLGKVYYGALGVMAATFFFMWYCVVIKRLRDRGRGHVSFFAYAIPILATLSALAPHFPLSCSVGIETRGIYLLAILPFWLVYFIDLGIVSNTNRAPVDETAEHTPEHSSHPGKA
ncbi:Protein of unknown function [Cohaesibacter sp. ES.047]|uniref:DUF805 domain-containing protein n=1 Tax=Cohaesibacter sp. ES.047 TaxID=1798205 RepID=UPI000BBF9239|nr:DUF805 domain-containing protein [Cohaesibacter sp. ES.047]SNY91861.1 Protein of unknown function [Cohaesibacter sp. ES.047]